jgi:hypothetical protein
VKFPQKTILNKNKPQSSENDSKNTEILFKFKVLNYEYV